MGAYKISEDLPDGWRVYVDRGEVLYYSSPEGLRFSTQEDVHDYLTDTDNFLVLGQQLVDAIHKKENDKVCSLLEKMDASNVNESYVTEWSFGLPIFPLQVACMVNNSKAVEKLLGIPGVNVNVENEDGMTPIMNAALSCSRKVLRIMLDHPDVDLDGRNKDGKGLKRLVYESEKLMAVKAKCLEMIKEAKEKLEERHTEQVTVVYDNNGDSPARQRGTVIVQNDENRNIRIKPMQGSVPRRKPMQGSVIPEAKRRRLGDAAQYILNRHSSYRVEKVDDEDEGTESEDEEHHEDNQDSGPMWIKQETIMRWSSVDQTRGDNEVEDIVDNGEDDDESDDNDSDEEEEQEEEEEEDTLNPDDVADLHPVNEQISHPLKAQKGHSLEDVRENIRSQYLDQIDKANVEIQEREQILSRNMKIREAEKMELKGKYNREKETFDIKLREDKYKIEQKKSKLEQKMAELQQTLENVRQDLTEIHEKGRRNDDEMKKRYKYEKTKIDRKFENEDEENKQNVCILKDKTKQLTKDLEKMVDVDDNDNNDSSNLKEAKETLECPICMEIMKPPTRIWMCPTSHLVCEPCKNQLLDQPCPTCRVERVTLRAFMAENFARTLFK